MVTRADHDAFAKQAAEAVYPVSDDEEDEDDDKGWGAKEWLTLALASGTLAAGLGAAYVYRKDIDKALGGRIFGDNREKVNAWLQDNLPGGYGAFGLGAGAGVAHSMVPALKRLPGGVDHNIQTTGGLVNKLNQGGDAAEPHLRAMGSHAAITDDKGKIKDPLDSGRALHTFTTGATVDPRHPLAILNHQDLFNKPTLLNEIIQGTAKGELIEDPSKKSFVRRVFGGNSDPAAATRLKNVNALNEHMAAAQRKIEANKANAATANPGAPIQLTQQEDAADKLHNRIKGNLGAKSVNVPGIVTGVEAAKRIGTPATLAGTAGRALTYGTLASLGSMLAEKWLGGPK
jgi:hypothetical protein